MKKTDTGLLAWLCFLPNPNWSRARWLGAGIGVGVFLLGAGLLILTVKDLTQAFLRIGPYAADGTSDGIRNSGLFLVALLGAPFLIWRTVMAQRQVDTAEASLLNDKIRDAAAGLAARREVTTLADDGARAVNAWEDDIVVRVAAIDTLEGLAEETPPEARRIERLLASYVRGTFPAQTLEPTEDLQTRKAPRLDLQAAVSALGRVHGDLVERGAVDYRLDLKACDFDEVDFGGGNFFAADLTASRMEAAIFQEANFDGCRFWGCLLNYGAFHGANFTGAKFDRAFLNEPVLPAGGMNEFIMAETVRGATFIGTDLRAVDYLGEGGKDACTFGTADTRLNDQLALNEPDISDLRLASRARSRMSRNAPLRLGDEEALTKVDASCLRYWSHVKQGDLMLGRQLSEFYETLDMKRWPYWEGP